MRKILVTSGLPYANGPIHLGHMVEYLQTDIWVRFQKLVGNDCIYVCGDDAHGTPIMLSAAKQGIAPEELIAKIKEEHERDFAGFLVEFDSFYTTHSAENRELVEFIYNKLNEKGDIEQRSITQAYDPDEQMFLPDRFVKGECPRCDAKEQYGDSCEICGATYATTDLKNSVSVISGATPIQKESGHYFFCLEKYSELLKKWLGSDHIQAEVVHKLNDWLSEGLKQWDISRDAPYFGFKIPGAEEKYFYVWLDAPIGYMAAFKKLCKERSELNFNDYWGVDSDAELYHFIGKDIIYFHALFWPAILTGAGFRTPSAIFTHGFLTVNGQKMSKSRGTFIKAYDYLQHLSPEYLRYYFAAKLTNRIDDIDLNLEDFMQRVNSDLVGKVVNIASRCAGFLRKKFDNKLSSKIEKPELLEEVVSRKSFIAKLYENREYSHAMREVMTLADKINKYVDEKKPWIMIKERGQEKRVHDVCSLAINLFKILMVFLKPALPEMAAKVERFLNIQPLTWSDIDTPLLDHAINRFDPLLQRVEQEQIDAILGKQ